MIVRLISIYLLTMYLSHLSLDNFRNYRKSSLEFTPQGALFYGPNGSGKTNLLEALFFLCTARSQRQASRDEMICFSSDYGYLEGAFARQDGSLCRTASIGFTRDKKITMKVDGVTLPSFSQWLGCATAIPFGPNDINLIQGLPQQRRTFIDLLLCQTDPAYLHNLIVYKKNCAQRNVLLPASADETAMDIYEQNMAASGAVIFLKRQELVSFMRPHFARFYREISGNAETASIDYKPSIRCELSTQNEWGNVFYRALKNTQKKDIGNGFSSIGPHRDDLVVSVNDRPAKPFASQGQCTTLTLSLRMCSILFCEVSKKETMLFLFDDALTYLDGERTSRVVPLVQGKGQIFIATSSEREMAVRDVPRFVVSRGQACRA
jgi:DNA replication and repair protein RecF